MRPITGSISVGDPPHSASLLRRSFHRMPSFSTRDPRVSSNLEAREIGSNSREVIQIVQNRFCTSAERFVTDLPFAFTNPISACDRGVSTVTSPAIADELYHAN